MCCQLCRGSYKSVLVALAEVVFTRAELAVYVQVLQRRAHAPRIKYCRGLSLVIRYMEWHKCGFRSMTFNHPFKLVGFLVAAFGAQPEESIGLALRG